MAPNPQSISVNAPKLTTVRLPNYKNPEVAGHYLGPMNIVLLSLSTIILIARIFARAYMLKSLGKDDIFIVLAWIFAIVVSVTQIMMIPLGWGRHTIDFWFPNASPMMLLTWINQWAYVASMALCKLSILCFFTRFAQSKPFRMLVYCTMGIVIGNGFIFAGIWIFRCNPVHAWWDMFTPNQKCYTQQQNIILTYVMTSLNLFLDVVVFVLPIRTIWQLRLPNLQKASLIFLMGLGLMCCIFAGLRLTIVNKTLALTDATWHGYKLWAYIALEIHLGIICSCLPFMKPIIVACIPSLAASFTSVKQHMKSLTLKTNSSTSPHNTLLSRRGSEHANSYPMEKSGLRSLTSPISTLRPAHTRSKTSSSIYSISSQLGKEGHCTSCGRPSTDSPDRYTRRPSYNGPYGKPPPAAPPVPKIPKGSEILVTTKVEISHEDLPLLIKQNESYQPDRRDRNKGGQYNGRFNAF